MRAILTDYGRWRMSQVANLGPWLSNPDVFLFKNDIVASPGLVWADMVECDFTGYLRWNGAVPDMAPIRGPAGQWGLTWASRLFKATGSAVPNVVRGWGVFDADVTQLMMVANLDNPVAITRADQGITLLAQWFYGD